MGATALVGRCMFAFVFLASSLNKLQTLSDPIAGAATLASIAPRLGAARALFRDKTGFPLWMLLPFTDRTLLTLAALTEGIGAALFIADSSLGAKMLMLFTLVVTPVMHPFWLNHDEGSAGVPGGHDHVLQKRGALRGVAVLARHATGGGGVQAGRCPRIGKRRRRGREQGQVGVNTSGGRIVSNEIAKNFVSYE